MNASEVIDNAADRIEEHGWWDGNPYDISGGPRYCVATSMPYTNDGETHLAVVEAIFKVTGISVESRDDLGPMSAIIDWNDAPGRTQREVLDMMRAAAKLARLNEETAA